MPTPTEARRFQEYLERARVNACMSPRRLAEQLGVHEDEVVAWEKGKSYPREEMLARIIATLALYRVRSQSDPLPAAGELGERLRAERRQRGVSQMVAAREIGVSQATLAAWETGRSGPSSQFIDPIALFMGEPVSLVRRYVHHPPIRTDHWSDLGRVVGRRRSELGLTREALSSAIGVSKSTLVAWELGYRFPRPVHVRALAIRLDLPVQALAGTMSGRKPHSALAELVQRRQGALGLRKQDLARLVGVADSTLSRWLQGRRVPSDDSLWRLSQVLDLPMAVLVRAASVG